MKAIMTVTGIDHTGIIAAVANACAAQNANITNVSQTPVSYTHLTLPTTPYV